MATSIESENAFYIESKKAIMRLQKELFEHYYKTDSSSVNKSTYELYDRDMGRKLSEVSDSLDSIHIANVNEILHNIG